MAIETRTQLSQVTILPLHNAINVQWSNQIIKDGEVIQETFHRKSYMANQKEEFLSEVEKAEIYLSTVNW